MAGMAGIYSTRGVESGSDKADDRSDEPSLRSGQLVGSIFRCHWPLRVRGTGGELDPISRDTSRQHCCCLRVSRLYVAVPILTDSPNIITLTLSVQSFNFGGRGQGK